MNTSNKNISSSVLTERFLSNYVIDISKKVNIFMTLIVIIIGLATNSITLVLFLQKRNRTNSSNVYLLTLALVDSLFLVAHFFEDSIRTIEEIYLEDEIKNGKMGQLIQILNIANETDAICRLINYFRYVLRFISAYIVVAFTLQRLFIVFKPLSFRFKSKNSAWFTVSLITITSLILNSWVPFFFQIQYDDHRKYCDPLANTRIEYFKIIFAYIILIILVPILIIFVSNSFIIYKTFKQEKMRKNLQNFELLSDCSPAGKIELSTTNLRIRNTASSKLTKTNTSNKIAKTLLIVSFSFAILNLPYFVCWLLYYLHSFNLTNNQENGDYLFASVKITEVFFVLNYGIKFFIYCASGTLFRERLYSSVMTKFSSK